MYIVHSSFNLPTTRIYLYLIMKYQNNICLYSKFKIILLYQYQGQWKGGATGATYKIKICTKKNLHQVPQIISSALIGIGTDCLFKLQFTIM